MLTLTGVMHGHVGGAAAGVLMDQAHIIGGVLGDRRYNQGMFGRRSCMTLAHRDTHCTGLLQTLVVELLLHEAPSLMCLPLQFSVPADLHRDVNTLSGVASLCNARLCCVSFACQGSDRVVSCHAQPCIMPASSHPHWLWAVPFCQALVCMQAPFNTPTCCWLMSCSSSLPCLYASLCCCVLKLVWCVITRGGIGAAWGRCQFWVLRYASVVAKQPCAI